MKLSISIDIGEADAREFADMIADALRRKKEEEKKFRIPDEAEVRAWMEEAAAEMQYCGYDAAGAAKLFCAHYSARSWQTGGKLITDVRQKAREWAIQDVKELKARKDKRNADECFKTFDVEEFRQLAERRTFDHGD